MIETNPLSFARRQKAALRRATFTSMGFPPGSLRDACRDDVLYGPLDLGPDDGPIDDPALADPIMRGHHPDGWGVVIYLVAAIPDRLVIAEWDIIAGRPARARRIVVRPVDLGQVFIQLAKDSARRYGYVVDHIAGPDATV